MWSNADGFWQGFFLLLIFLPLVFIWVFTLFDIFRRDDLKGWHTALWILLVVLLPLLGMLIYFIARPVTKQDIQIQEAYEDQQEFNKVSAATDKLYKLSQLRDKGDISQEEFEKQKAKLIKS